MDSTIAENEFDNTNNLVEVLVFSNFFYFEFMILFQNIYNFKERIRLM